MAKAVRIVRAGGPEVLKLEEIERPIAGPEEILVEVVAAGLNRADCLQRRGLYPAPEGVAPDIPGLEFSGVVCELGPGTRRWKIGDSVMGICSGAAMATHVAIPEVTAMRTPIGMDSTTAGAIPEVFVTAFDALSQADWAAQKSILIHAIGSGVGSAALLLAKQKGMRVVGTSRSQEKLDQARALGLAHAILVSDGQFAKATRDATDGGCDAILDFIGAAYLKENLKSLAPRGKLVVIGLLGGATGELPLGLLLAKRASIIGTVLRSRSLSEKAELTKQFSEEILPSFDSGELSPLIDRVFPMSEISDAHRYLEENRNFGKVVMRW